MNWNDIPDNKEKKDDQAQSPENAVRPTEATPGTNSGVSWSDADGAPATPAESFAWGQADDAQQTSRDSSGEISAAEPFVGDSAGAAPARRSTSATPATVESEVTNNDEDDTEYEYEDDVPEKKSSKLKTYALVGGVLTVLVGLVGTGLAVKFGGSNQPQFEPRNDVAGTQPVASMPVPPEPPRAQTAVSPEPAGVPTTRQSDPLPFEQAAPATTNLESVPGSPMPYVDMQALQDLVQADVIDKLDRLTQNQTQLEERVSALEERSQAQGDTMDQFAKDMQALQEAVTELKESQSAATQKDEKKAAATPPAKAEPAKKAQAPAPKPVTRSAPAPKPAISAPKVQANTELASARVVGVYPSRNPTLAYVVSDRGLTTVRPGDMLLGARVLRLDGLTVVTTAGRVRPQ